MGLVSWSSSSRFDHTGEWVLVTAAAGGVGTTAVQIAKALGAKVIAAASSDEKIEVAKKYCGADHGVNYSKAGWQKEVLAITRGKGVDVVYDPVGLINGGLPKHPECW
jgi:NADPH2:quinone reductase